MLFAVSPGTAGSGSERFVAFLPFWLSPGSLLQLPDGVRVAAGPGGKLSIERLHHLYAATLGPFSTAAEAEEGLNALRTAVLWCAMEFSIGLRYPVQASSVELFEQPYVIPPTQPMAHIGRLTGWTHTDGHYEADAALVRPEHKRLFRIEVGSPTVTAGIAVDRFLEKAEAALSFPRLAVLSSNRKLTLAVEIAMSHRFEASDRAQFIFLVTALEALLPDLSVTKTTASALDDAVSAIKSRRSALQKNDPELKELDRVLNRVSKLKQESVGEKMRSFVDAAVRRHPSLGDRDLVSAQIREAYRTRSTLLHQGNIDPKNLQERLSFLRQLVPQLLRALFLEHSHTSAAADAA